MSRITFPMVMRYALAMVISVIVIVIAVILGDYGPWYFSWLLGTGFMMLVAVSGAVLLDAQDEARAAGAAGKRAAGKFGATRSNY
ncbi:hypothetical protein QTH87_19480 [Variovorax sp. J22P168]|uniref:hypothetical protein n=1 Tax=Variovorax jilinensis TaxID=3053513 RepID=UPI002578B1DF|nr:hypothetical protein [Variovorax sp. J22P168]MDM0014633.1 hypothetical protein [Variovorax sp. J22P168]